MADFDAAVAAIRAQSDARRRDFLVTMLDGANLIGMLPEDASLDALEAAYEEHYDAIWLDGSTSDDNERHDADEYHDGYQAGLAFALQTMSDNGFTLPPLPEKETA